MSVLLLPPYKKSKYIFHKEGHACDGRPCEITHIFTHTYFGDCSVSFFEKYPNEYIPISIIKMDQLELIEGEDERPNK